MSGKISNANIAECSDSYRRKGYTALVSRRSTQNLNLMLADGKYKFIKVFVFWLALIGGPS